MRIRPKLEQRHHTPGPKARARSHKRPLRSWLALALGIALVSTFGIWYGIEGHQILSSLLPGRFRAMGDKANGLPTVHVDVGHEAYQALERQWREAPQKGILHLDAGDWLPAGIRFQGREIPVRVWLDWEAGDRQQDGRWPLQVAGDGVETVLGMRGFSAQPVRTGRTLDEWLYVQELRRTDVLAPGYALANVFVNGVDWGAYALKERLTGEWIESQARGEGVLVRLRDRLFWRPWLAPVDLEYAYWSVFADPVATAFDLPTVAQVDEPRALAGETGYAAREQSTAALGLLRAFQEGQLAASLVFDAERMGRYVAHANLWGVRQGSAGHGERYYYNPATATLEPVGSEPLALAPRSTHWTDLGQYDDPEIMRAYAQEVLRISRPEYLDELRARYGREIDQAYAALSQELAASNVTLPWPTLARRQVLLLSALRPEQAVYAYQGSAIAAETDSVIELEVGNLLPYPVVLEQLSIGDRTAEVQCDWVSEDDAALVHECAAASVVLRGAPGAARAYVTLHIPSAAIEALDPQGDALAFGTLELVTRIVGIEEPIVTPVERDYPAAMPDPVRPVQLSIAEALERYPFLAASEQPGFLEIQQGTWPVPGDLVLPHGVGLRATRAITLTFDPGAILYATGPLMLRGPHGQGIHLLPKQADWGGIVVLQTDPHAASLLVNVEVRGASGIRREGWVSTGGVTFYESSVSLQGCRLLDVAAPSAIHVVRAQFKISDTEFANASGDGLDADHARGRIEQSTYHDVLGNAIRARGSQVDIVDVDLMQVYESGILADGGSVVSAQRVRATDVGTAIASKDASYVHARDVSISQVWVAGLVAYGDDSGGGPASIHASQVVYEEDVSVHALAETDSSVTVDGLPTVAGEVDRAALERRPVVPGGIRVLSYRLGPTIRLMGYDLPDARVAPGETLELVLYWRAVARPPVDYTVFVHILDASGQNVAGQDTMPRENTFPTSGWPVGEAIDDVHRIPLPADLPSGEYRLALGMYTLRSGERLPVIGPDGLRIPEAWIVLDHSIKVR